jgi:plasmid replication initiation protein
MALSSDKEKNLIVQSNEIIESCYSMPLNEKRLLMLGMSKVDPIAFPLEDEPLKIDVTATEWTKFCSDSNPYVMLKRVAEGLRGRYVRFKPEAGVIEDANWLDSIKYHEKEGRISIRFGWTIHKRLMGMLKEFTKTNLLESTALESFHAVRLYELISQFKGNRLRGWRKITIDDFRFSMNCQNRYLETKDLKKYVIKKSIKEINEKTSLFVTVEDIKKGRTITGFKFVYEVQHKSKNIELANV